ncbi:stage III sporulation protein AA [Vallitalea okinawensis]|uniref:stage III sporulation protein AA n=1 Tax=Vallitalea okinawensis TaxID=2078660 RepID=UPI000CFCBE31|nr:stage III sporulation protein AA [Vallitalea okinawensis]
MSEKQMILPLLSTELREIFQHVSEEIFNDLQEIRLRVQKPIVLNIKDEYYYFSESSELTREQGQGMILNEKDLLHTLELISDYSLYAFEEELKQGYITVKGGHRVGIVGKTILDKGSVRTIRHISGMNIRIAHEVIDCANLVMPFIKENENSIYHTLIVSPPRCGKTTLLRDIIRQIADKLGINVGVVDERSEIAGCYKGIPQKDIGLQTDVLDGCPKAEGMMMLLRSMGPQVIAVDEIGSEEDLHAIQHIIHAGIKLICTVHGYSYEDISRKPVLNRLLEDKIFERIIFLDNSRSVGTVTSIINEKGSEIFKKEGKYYVY